MSHHSPLRTTKSLVLIHLWDFKMLYTVYIMAQHVQFKLALIVFKYLHGLAPSYLTEICVHVSSMAGRRPLRSADTRTLYVPRTRTDIGARNFAVAGPRVWNSLPPKLRMLNCTVCTFAAKLKTFLFSAVSASENF